MSDADNGGSKSKGEIRLHVFGRTDVGQVREHNEDNFLVADLTRKSRSLMESDRQ
jgi:protein phosphatase